MLFELYNEGYFNYKNYLFDNASELELSPNEVSIMIYLLDEFRLGNNIISLSKMEQKILLHKSEITQSLSKLLERNFYNVYVSYENDLGVERYSVEVFFNYLEKSYKSSSEDNNTDEDINRILTYVEKHLKRVMTANEYDIILQLINDENKKYSDFKETIAYIEKAKYDVTIRNIQKFIDSNISSKEKNKNSDVEEFMKKIGLRR